MSLEDAIGEYVQRIIVLAVVGGILAAVGLLFGGSYRKCSSVLLWDRGIRVRRCSRVNDTVRGSTINWPYRDVSRLCVVKFSL